MNATALPPGYRLEGRDEWRWDWEEERQIYGVLAISLLLIFMVTAALFEILRTRRPKDEQDQGSPPPAG